MDPTQVDPWARWLAFVHPAFMLGVLVLLLLTLRFGLALRRLRRGGRPLGGDQVKQHVRWARVAVGVLAVGFLAGPVSAVWLRNWAPFGTLHGGLAVLAVALFFSAAWFGQALYQGRSRAATLHGGLALAGVGLAALAALAGLVLLP